MEMILKVLSVLISGAIGFYQTKEDKRIEELIFRVNSGERFGN